MWPIPSLSKKRGKTGSGANIQNILSLLPTTGSGMDQSAMNSYGSSVEISIDV